MGFKKKHQNENILRSLFDYHVNISEIHKDNAFQHFFYKSRNHYLLNILIASNEYYGKGFAFEEICRLLNPRFASRTTI